MGTDNNTKDQQITFIQQINKMSTQILKLQRNKRSQNRKMDINPDIEQIIANVQQLNTIVQINLQKK